MEDKLKQLKFIYEGSVVDFSDGDSMAIGIVKDFPYGGWRPLCGMFVRARHIR